MSTAAPWDAMTPRQRDALVAEHVMGWLHVRPIPPHNREYMGQSPGSKDVNQIVYDYTTDIATAWQVVAHMRAQGLKLWLYDWLGGANIEAAFTNTQEGRRAAAKTDMEAICLAALRIKGIDV